MWIVNRAVAQVPFLWENFFDILFQRLRLCAGVKLTNCPPGTEAKFIKAEVKNYCPADYVVVQSERFVCHEPRSSSSVFVRQPIHFCHCKVCQVSCRCRVK